LITENPERRKKVKKKWTLTQECRKGDPRAIEQLRQKSLGWDRKRFLLTWGDIRRKLKGKRWFGLAEKKN